MKTCLFSSLLFISMGAGAASHGLGREQSMDDDLAGPRIVWLGQIAGTVTDGDDTCFILNRVDDLYGGYALTATKFITCNPGSFEDEAFSAGKVLRVEGNLGPDIRRHIGGQDINAHVVAAPKLVSQPDLTTYRSSPYYDGYPYAYENPFFDPWYPHSGIWFGYHHHWR